MAKPKKLPSGNWRVRVYDYTDKDNKKHYKSFTAPSKKEVMMLANEYIVTRGTETYEDMSLAEAYSRYINSKSAILSPTTIRGYKLSEKNDFPKLMKYPISKITQENIQIAVNEMALTLSPKTIRNRYGLLVSVLNTYRPQFRFRITLPKPRRSEKDYIIPTTEEVNKLLAAADERIRVPILLASAGSLRRSEVCALTPEDITDFGVNINKSKVINNDNEYVVKKSNKTQAGTRFVSLPPEILKEVKEWKYFDCTPTQIQEWFEALRKKVDINTTFHKLRHYFASECHANGIPDKYIAKMGGWADLSVLQRIYQHTLQDKEKEMNDKITSLFNKNFKKYDTNMTQKNKKPIGMGS